jgi:hypothetical protein
MTTPPRSVQAWMREQSNGKDDAPSARSSREEWQGYFRKRSNPGLGRSFKELINRSSEWDLAAHLCAVEMIARIEPELRRRTRLR